MARLDASRETATAALRQAEEKAADRTVRVETAQGRLATLLAEVGRVQSF